MYQVWNGMLIYHSGISNWHFFFSKLALFFGIVDTYEVHLYYQRSSFVSWMYSQGEREEKKIREETEKEESETREREKVREETDREGTEREEKLDHRLQVQLLQIPFPPYIHILVSTLISHFIISIASQVTGEICSQALLPVIASVKEEEEGEGGSSTSTEVTGIQTAFMITTSIQGEEHPVATVCKYVTLPFSWIPRDRFTRVTEVILSRSMGSVRALPDKNAQLVGGLTIFHNRSLYLI